MYSSFCQIAASVSTGRKVLRWKHHSAIETRGVTQERKEKCDAPRSANALSFAALSGLELGHSQAEVGAEEEINCKSARHEVNDRPLLRYVSNCLLTSKMNLR